MKKFIKLLSIALTVVVMFAMAACKEDPDDDKGKGKDENNVGEHLAFELINSGTAYRVRKGTVNSGDVVIPATHSSVRSSRSTDNELPVLEIGAPTDGEAEGAFRGTKIKSIIIPEGVKGIYAGAFGGCTELTSVTLPESLEEIGFCAFSGSEKLARIDIPSGTIIGIGAFVNCFGLTEVTIGEGIEEISNTAFDFCKNLTSINIPESVTSIGRNAFADCQKLTSITLPEGLQYIGSGAFTGTTKISEITIPASVKSVGDPIYGTCLFFGWTAEQTIYVEGFASEEEADEAWFVEVTGGGGREEKGAWRNWCNAKIVYAGQ